MASKKERLFCAMNYWPISEYNVRNDSYLQSKTNNRFFTLRIILGKFTFKRRTFYFVFLSLIWSEIQWNKMNLHLKIILKD